MFRVASPSLSSSSSSSSSYSQVSVDFTQLSCLTAAGVGKGHWVRVSIGGQLSNAFEANITYAAPNVADYVMSWDKSLTQVWGGGGDDFLVRSRRSI